MNEVSAEACLARAKVFADLDLDGRKRLAQLAQPEAVAKGAVVMQEGTPGDAFYLLVQGILHVDTKDQTDEPRRIATVQAGTVLGEIAVLTREPRTATVTAETDAKLLRFEMLGVLSVLKDYPRVLADLNRLGVQRSEELLEDILDA
jgi:CRP-like cAMP-binding protein